MNLFPGNKKWPLVALHCVIWALVFMIPYLLDRGPRPYMYISGTQEIYFLYLRSFTFCFWIGGFYLNSEVLTPRLIYRRKIVAYTLLLILMLAIVLLGHGILYHSLMPEHYSLFRAIRYNMPTFVLTIAISILYRMTRDNINAEKTSLQKQEENLKTELSFLRSQISPHFVFNVLNNIVAMVRLKNEDLEETVIKLSSLMQYMLYETDNEKVLLKREAEYLQSYIDLQQQRFGSKVKVDTQIELSNDWIEIEPMLLIPFVENAFKHGIGMIENPQISIRLKTDDNVLHFTVENRYNAHSTETRDKTSGIGLANVRRRLNLLYSTDHELKIEPQDDWFRVSLRLNLHA